MLFTILGIIFATFLFYHYMVKHYNYWKEKGVKQGNPWWILGDNWGNCFRIQSFADMIEYVYNQCPGTRYSGMYQFFLPALLVKDPDLIKQVTVKDFDHFVDHRTFVPAEVDPLWGNNLVALRGQKWREMRTILSPTFTSSKMRAMFVLMAECAENWVQYFLDKNEDIVTIEVKDSCTRFANDVIATTAFGVKVDSMREPKNEFYLMGKDATDFVSFFRNLKLLGFIMLPKLFAVLKIKLFSYKVREFFVNLVSSTIKIRKEQGIVRPDMINLLLEAQKGNQKQEENDIIDTGFATAQESDLVKTVGKQSRNITDANIVSQALVFFFAGFETISNLMVFLSYELAVNPDIQERLRNEVRETLEECGGKLTYEGLLKMKYMDMVVSEALRKWPNAVATDRVCTKAYTIQPTMPGEKPLHLEEGAVLFIPIYGIQRDPQHFPDPEHFDPERFSDENKHNIKPYTYFPFGVGPRNCIGSRFALLEAKSVCFYLLLHFQLVPVEKTMIPLQISKRSFNLGFDRGLWVGLKRLKH
ncbi:hypothetical protein NQ318_019140 [Aromia moschata]|uniref:Cytochrome P450 n=1 Tax=Aromia moschata TaxID=1265417 RepID=A0AAV8YQS1_9CUCU|nr:hypothetical protein NQ318_019140 [Aromia moschata]